MPQLEGPTTRDYNYVLGGVWGGEEEEKDWQQVLAQVPVFKKKKERKKIFSVMRSEQNKPTEGTSAGDEVGCGLDGQVQVESMRDPTGHTYTASLRERKHNPTGQSCSQTVRARERRR